MDAMIENVRSSFEVSVRKMLPKKPTLIQPDKKLSKVFGVSIVDLCAYENNTVPYLVKDICSFIRKNYLCSEGIFRLSAPSSQVLKLREAFEAKYGFYDDKISVTALAEVDGNTAANVLKQFLRQLPEALIEPSILKIAKDSTCVSDETFATNTRLLMENWPVAKRCTLQYLLSFLQLVMRNAENRMTVTGLAVVFGPNVFEISSGIEGLEQQALANKTFERLLLTSDIICENLPDDQGYLKMASPTSPPSKPVRLAPPVPKQARPLPPPPIPQHGEGDGVVPGIPHREESLEHDILDLTESQSEDLSDDVIIVSPDKLLIEKTISHVIHKHLFNDSATSTPRFTEDSDNDSDIDDNCALLPLASIPDVEENSNNNKTETLNEKEALYETIPQIPDLTPTDTSENPTNPDTAFLQPTTVTTPDSGCLTAEDELKNTRVIVPKLDLQGAIEDNESVAMETVPPLDLSDFVQADVVTQPKPLPRKLKTTPTKTKKKRRKNNELSPKPVAYQQLKSEPISIPDAHRHESSDNDNSDVIVNFSPKEEGSARWRDAWSTDDDEVYPQFVDKLSKYQGEKEDGDVELAPSSPIQHQFPRTHHHHHHHKHHHHHNNHSSSTDRPKVTKGFKEPDNLNEIEISLENIFIALETNRKINGRPEDLTLMTRDQIKAEKLSMQKELLSYEGRHGRPSTKAQKEIMRSVYDRYRMVKRLLVDVMSPPFHSTLRRYDDADFECDVNNEDGEDAFGVTQLLTLNPSHQNNSTNLPTTNSDHVSGDLGITELRKQQRQVKGQCKRMRRKIKEFEKEFKEQNNRSVTQADRVVMATEYSEYKEMKAKLRLLEALIEKHIAPFRSP